jgi:hypothetical protein
METITINDLVITLSEEAIQSIPDHKCPTCGAPGEPFAPGGIRMPDYPEWTSPWRYYGEGMSPLMKAWEDRIATVLFSCHCPHHEGRALRVVRIGDAIYPLTFINDWNSPFKERAAFLDSGSIALFNRILIAQEVEFLANHADPSKLAGIDKLRRILYAVASGDEQPDHAYQRVFRLFASAQVEHYFVNPPNAVASKS